MMMIVLTSGFVKTISSLKIRPTRSWLSRRRRPRSFVGLRLGFRYSLASTLWDISYILVSREWNHPPHSMTVQSQPQSPKGCSSSGTCQPPGGVGWECILERSNLGHLVHVRLWRHFHAESLLLPRLEGEAALTPLHQVRLLAGVERGMGGENHFHLSIVGIAKLFSIWIWVYTHRPRGGRSIVQEDAHLEMIVRQHHQHPTLYGSP